MCQLNPRWCPVCRKTFDSEMVMKSHLGTKQDKAHKEYRATHPVPSHASGVVSHTSGQLDILEAWGLADAFVEGREMGQAEMRVQVEKLRADAEAEAAEAARRLLVEQETELRKLREALIRCQSVIQDKEQETQAAEQAVRRLLAEKEQETQAARTIKQA